MTVSESKIKIYRSQDTIHALMQVLIDSYFTSLGDKVGKRELTIINKIKSLDIDISKQFMFMFQAPLNNNHFKDLTNQLMVPLITELVDTAYLKGIITKKEADLMNIILATND